ncbi:hypothetical protein LCGC14_2310710 [marine sediment metagenome]|uniref:Uncharacterized protein n=1 Tax=marine sediment metagenome TaxID=412755 RepID=A0A0F9CL86_9ZZZZ
MESLPARKCGDCKKEIQFQEFLRENPSINSSLNIFFSQKF